MEYQVHMCISIPPKYAVPTVAGYLKGKSAIAIARQFQGKRRNYNHVGSSFWARGYYVSTVASAEAVVRAYIRNQEKEDEHLEQLNLPVTQR